MDHYNQTGYFGNHMDYRFPVRHGIGRMNSLVSDICICTGGNHHLNIYTERISAGQEYLKTAGTLTDNRRRTQWNNLNSLREISDSAV